MPPESALVRKVRGPMADWDLHAMLLRLIEFRLAGANWQRAGKGERPKPVDLPDTAGEAPKPQGADIAARLRALGMIPADGSDEPPGAVVFD